MSLTRLKLPISPSTSSGELMSFTREGKALRHDHFEKAYKLVHSFASNSALGSVCFVTGASGAGKTTLLETLANELYGDSIPEDKIPLISLFANNHQQGRFSQKKLIFDMFSALGDPFRSDPTEVLPKDVLANASDEIDDLAEWRWTSVIERLATSHGLEVLIIDEGQLMCLAPGRHSPSDYVDALRVLAMKARIRIIIAGTYDLLEVWNYNSQINRRSLTVHIDRYDSTLLQKAKFLGVLKGIEEQFKLPDGFLAKHASKLYKWSFGVPGEVYSHVERATIHWKASDSEMLLWEHFEDSKHLPPQLLRLEEEINVGEAILFSKTLRSSLQSLQQHPNSSAKGGKRQRNPTRLPVGAI